MQRFNDNAIWPNFRLFLIKTTFFLCQKSLCNLILVMIKHLCSNFRGSEDEMCALSCPQVQRFKDKAIWPNYRLFLIKPTFFLRRNPKPIFFILVKGKHLCSNFLGQKIRCAPCGVRRCNGSRTTRSGPTTDSSSSRPPSSASEPSWSVDSESHICCIQNHTSGMLCTGSSQLESSIWSVNGTRATLSRRITS